jgi:hypothetical protein
MINSRNLSAKADQAHHHGIQTKRVEQWRDRWDVLGIF